MNSDIYYEFKYLNSYIYGFRISSFECIYINHDHFIDEFVQTRKPGQWYANWFVSLSL